MPPAKKEARRRRRAGRARTPAFVKNLRGVKNWKEVSDWLEWRGIEDIECITPDQAGVARGKMMPSKKFTSNTSLALPSAVFMATISGGYPEDGNGFRLSRGRRRPQADAGPVDADGRAVGGRPDRAGDLRPRPPGRALGRVHAAQRAEARRRAYAEDGLRPVVAPEIEFYLVRKNPDPDYPLTPPVGRSGRPIGGGAGYSIAGVNEFDELIDDIYHFSESQGLEIDTLIHEEGAGQLEINLRHGDPVELADQVFMFKRTIREAALKHDTYATFMAKPIQGQPGSAMHIHQSIIDKKTGSNIFTDEDGAETDAFFHFIGGMQKHVPNALVMFAPYVNSYRRLTQAASAPVNNKWGYDNRTTAFRVPRSDPAARRVENRIPSSDANPYLALAASLACGLIGSRNKIKPDAPVADHRQRGRDRPAARPARSRRPVRGRRGAAGDARQFLRRRPMRRSSGPSSRPSWR